jgi:hypothetical protein
MRMPKDVSSVTDQGLELIRTRYLGLSRRIRKLGDILLANVFSDLSKLHRVHVFNDDVRTVMRYARTLTPDTRSLSDLQHMNPGLTLPFAASHCDMCLPEAGSSEMVMWKRYSNRLNGGITSAGYTWIPIVGNLILSPDALIVGNGNGGLADLLLTVSKCRIIGLDLEADMPSGLATLLNYVPVGIELNHSSRFIQSDYSLTTSGDWSDSEVRQQVLDSLPGVCTVIIDITSPDALDYPNIVLEMMNHRKVSRVYFRVICDEEVFRSTLSLLRKEVSVEFWISSRTYHSMEILVHVAREQVPVHECASSPSLIDVGLDVTVHTLIPERTEQLLEAATCSCITWRNETLQEAGETMYMLCRSLLDKSDNIQLRYQKRIDLILGYSTLVAAISDDPVSCVQEWLQDEQIETDLFVYAMNSKARIHLLRYVPRILHYRPGYSTIEG